MRGLAGELDELLDAEAVGKIRAGRDGVAVPMEETFGQGFYQRDSLVQGRIGGERGNGDFFRRAVFGTARELETTGEGGGGIFQNEGAASP